MVHGIKRGVIQFLTVAILSGICLVFGFAPNEFLAGLVINPPPWLSHPATRLVALILGGVLWYVGWRVSRPLREWLFSLQKEPPGTIEHPDVRRDKLIPLQEAARKAGRLKQSANKKPDGGFNLSILRIT